MHTPQPKTQLGLRGHFALADRCKMIAHGLGWGLVRSGPGRYRIDPVPDIHALCPPYVRHEASVFDNTNLTALLEFVHQPVRATLARMPGATAQKQHEMRVMIHRLLRLMTTGSVIIPPDRYQSLEGESAACHAGPERKARDSESWENAPEISGQKPRLSSIPQTRLDTERGFLFDLAAPDVHESPAHVALREKFWALARRNPQNLPTRIAFDAETFIRLCQQAARQRGTIAPLLARAEQAEITAQHIHSIRARTLPDAPQAQIELAKTLSASAALVPLLNTAAVQSLWTDNYHSRRSIPAAEMILREYQVFSNIVHQFLTGQIPEISAPAIVQEFAPLLSFLAQWAQIMDRADLQQQLIPESAQKDVVLGDHHEKLLEALSRAAGKAGSLPRQWARTMRDWAQDFWGDIKSATREHPRLSASFIAASLLIGGYVYHQKQQKRELENNTVLMARETLEARLIDVAPLPEEARRTQNWHYDYFLGGFVRFKHYMYDGFIIGPVQVVYDTLERAAPKSHKPVFIQAANTTIKPVSDLIFYGDAFQNFTHVFYLGGCLYLGFRLGTHRTIGLFGEFLQDPIDMAHYTAAVAGRKIRRQKNPLPLHIEDMRARLHKNLPTTEFQTVAQTNNSPLSLKTIVLGTGTTATLFCVALDMADHGTPLTNAISQGAGHGSAAVLVAGAFIVYNFFQDILLIHIAGGLSNVICADIAGNVWRRAIKPVMLAAAEAVDRPQAPSSPYSAPAIPFYPNPQFPYY